MKKYQELIIDIRLFDAEVELLQASTETDVDIFDFDENWLTGGSC